MKCLLCAVATIALMVPAVAGAQTRDNHQNRHRTEHRQSRPNHQRPQHRPSRPARPEHRPSRPETRPSHPVHALPVYRPGHRPPTYHRVRARPFHYPHGYRYRRWSTGLILPHVFLSNYYYWNDWSMLGLGPPPHGFVWVRYGPDLLLVNRRTGRIVDVIYGAFY